MSDRYTKIVLTIIASALVVIAGENVKWVKDARAQSYGPTHVVIDSVQSYAFQYAGPLTVRVAQ